MLPDTGDPSLIGLDVGKLLARVIPHLTRPVHVEYGGPKYPSSSSSGAGAAEAVSGSQRKKCRRPDI
jgi:hypothetical protein